MKQVMVENCELLASFGQPYLEWREREIDRLLAKLRIDPEAKSNLIICGVSGSGKSIIIDQLGYDWSNHPRLVDWQQRHRAEFKFYHHSLGNDIRVARQLGRVNSSLGEMSSQEYWAVDEVGLWGNRQAQQYLAGPGLIINEAVALSGGFDQDGRVSDQVGKVRGLRQFQQLIDGDPSVAMIYVHGSPTNLATFAYRQAVLASKSEAQLRQIQQRFRVIDHRPWRKIVEGYKQSGNQAVSDQTFEDLYRLTADLIKQNKLPDDGWSGGYRDFYERDFEGWMEYLRSEYVPYLIKGLYGVDQLPKQVLMVHNQRLDRAIHRPGAKIQNMWSLLERVIKITP